MSGLEGLYRQVILEEAAARRGEGALEAPDAARFERNPSCGDELTMELALDGDRIEALRWRGDGCSISMASTSALTRLAEGSTIDEARARIAAFRGMLRDRGRGEPDEELLGDAVAFQGVGRYVMRVKCAMLAWVALEACLDDAAAKRDAEPGAG